MKIYLNSTMANCIKQTASLAFERGIKLKKKCYIFAEDKITFSIENELAKLCGGGFWDVEITTFKRYISQRKTDCKVLSKESSVMVIRKIISENERQLNCLSNSAIRPNFALTLYELISQLESANVNADDLNKLINNEQNKVSGALLLKIKDIALIYKKYEEYLINTKTYDSNDYFSLMPNLVREDENLKNSIVILSGFSSVTMQRQDVFKQLNTTCLEMIASIVYDKNSHFYTSEVLDKLLKIDKCEIINSNETLLDEVNFIKTNLYNPNVFKRNFTKFESDKISLYEAYSPLEEVEDVAKDILQEVHANNRRFKDVAIFLGNVSSYYPYVAKFFKEYDIPYYIDEKTTLKEHPLTSLILDYLNLVRKGFHNSDFIKFVSNSLFCLDKELADGLCNYVLKYALSRNLLKSPFKYQAEKLNEYEQLRKKVYDVYLYLEKAKVVSDYVNGIKKMLSYLNVEKNILLLGDKLTLIGEHKLADVNDKVLEKLLEILDEIEGVIGDIKISHIDFKNILLSGVTATTIGKIPLFNDAVYIGDSKNIKNRRVALLYAVGLSGDIPFSKSDTSLLSDGDLTELDGFKLIVEPKVNVVNEREKADVCLSLISFTDKLKLSFSDVSTNGNANTKSEIINYFTAMFNLNPRRKIFDDVLTNFKEEGFEKYSHLKFLREKPSMKSIAELSYKYRQGDPTTRIEVASFYKALEELENTSLKEKTDNLLKEVNNSKNLKENPLQSLKNNYISSTLLEGYFGCPYSNYAKNFLKLKEVEMGEMKANETGTLLHELIENYVKNLDKVKDLETSNSLVENLLEEIFNREEYSRYLNNSMYLFIFNQLKKEGKRACFAIFNSINSSDFKPEFLEVPFNDTSYFKPILLNTKKGQFKITGKIDRIDKYKNNIRVIDYKTGTIENKEELFYTGNKLQLYLYMNAFVNDELTPAGIYYFPIQDGYLKPEETRYKMKGKTLDEKEVLKATDLSLKEGKSSEFVSIKLKNDGELDSRSDTISKEGLEKYLKYAIKISEKGVEEMATGFIEPTPYENHCKYCKLKGMCGFSEEEGGEYRKATNISSKTIQDAVDFIKEEN